MKNSIFYIVILVSILMSERVTSQPNPCICDVQVIPIVACCVEVHIAMGLNCGGLIQELKIDANGNLPFTGTITSAIANATGVTVNTNAIQDIANFSFGSSFVITGSYQVIGELCFTDINNGAVAPTFEMTGSGVTYCSGIVEFPAACPTPGEWKKIYGTSEEETVNKVKAFNDGVYVVGRKQVNGIDYASFTKFDITDGSLLWEKYLDVESEFRDFDYNPVTDEFIVVGHTLPLWF